MPTERDAADLDSPRRRRERGQSLVEFALVFPIFIVMMMGFLEFTFVFNALLSIGHASRDATLIAAEAGDNADADCLILQQVEQDVTAPAVAARIQTVDIYKTDANGTPTGNIDSYSRSGTTTCGSISVPYTATSLSYKPGVGNRCNELSGCGGLDTVAVKITYKHTWVTPLSSLLNLTGTGPTLVQSNAMRMEPVL